MIELIIASSLLTLSFYLSYMAIEEYYSPYGPSWYWCFSMLSFSMSFAGLHLIIGGFLWPASIILIGILGVIIHLCYQINKITKEGMTFLTEFKKRLEMVFVFGINWKYYPVYVYKNRKLFKN